MTRTAVLMARIAVLCLCVVPQVAAEPVMITSGSMVFSGPGPRQAGTISLFGTRGFSVQGFVDSGEGLVDPLRQCFPCIPEQNFSVGALLGGLAISGHATLDGEVFRTINGLASYAQLRLDLGGTTALPPVQGSSIAVTVPFTLLEHSSFQFPLTPDDPPELGRVLLRGGGTVTLTLSANPTAPVWEFSHVRYDFQPIPEPATLVLVGGTLVGALFGRSMRRKSRSGGRRQHSAVTQ